MSGIIFWTCLTSAISALQLAPMQWQERAQQESGEERVTAKSRPMMNLTARMPSVVSSSTSSNPGGPRMEIKILENLFQVTIERRNLRNRHHPRFCERGLWSILVFSRVEKWSCRARSIRETWENFLGFGSSVPFCVLRRWLRTHVSALWLGHCVCQRGWCLCLWLVCCRGRRQFGVHRGSVTLRLCSTTSSTVMWQVTFAVAHLRLLLHHLLLQRPLLFPTFGVLLRFMGICGTPIRLVLLYSPGVLAPYGTCGLFLVSLTWVMAASRAPIIVSWGTRRDLLGQTSSRREVRHPVWSIGSRREWRGVSSRHGLKCLFVESEDRLVYFF